MKISCHSIVQILGAALLGLSTTGNSQNIPAEIEAIHEDIWKRFVSPEGLVLDYTNPDGSVDMPTPEEALAAKPNAVSWWTPVENGAFHSGIYLQTVVRRAKITGSQEDKEKARRLAKGLMNCASVGSVPGFVARYVLSDGQSHYAMGSDDQTGPWFSGLWDYVRSGIPTEEERAAIVEKMTEVATALKATRWLLPCDPIGNVKRNEFRGGFSGPDFRGVSRLLFVVRILEELTQDPAWSELYLQLLSGIPHGGDKSRLDVINEAMLAAISSDPVLAKHQWWIFANTQSMLRELWLLETDPKVREVYRHALQANAEAVLPTLLNAESQPASPGAPFNTNWRELCESWRPQTTTQETTELASEQYKQWNNQGRVQEIVSIREPLCAALIYSLSPDSPGDSEAAKQAFQRLAAGTNWKELHSSFGIFAEATWYQMQDGATGSSKK